MNILTNEGKFKECNVKIYGGKVMRSYAISEKGEIMGIRFIGNFAFSSRFFFSFIFIFAGKFYFSSKLDRFLYLNVISIMFDILLTKYSMNINPVLYNCKKEKFKREKVCYEILLDVFIYIYIVKYAKRNETCLR